MEKLKAFLRRKDIEISIKRYGIDALGAMAQGLFCSLLIGTIINTLGTQFHISFLTTAVASEMSYASGLQRQALFSIALVLFLFIMLITATLNFFLKRQKDK